MKDQSKHRKSRGEKPGTSLKNRENGMDKNAVPIEDNRFSTHGRIDLDVGDNKKGR